MFGRLPKRVMDDLKHHTATTHLAARPKVTVLVLGYVGVFTIKATVRHYAGVYLFSVG